MQLVVGRRRRAEYSEAWAQESGVEHVGPGPSVRVWRWKQKEGEPVHRSSTNGGFALGVFHSGVSGNS